jgi:SsrA-binding protein
MNPSDDIKIVARNRKARRDYNIHSSLEAGIELRGSEVKSIRAGKINLSDAYALIENGEIILKNLHISEYPMAADKQHTPLRPRKLLLHKREIKKLAIQTEQKGMTLIPLTIYFKGPFAKVELAVASGRKKYDKRQAIAKAEAQRRMKQAIRKDQR